ncbi:hypothetical protein EW093_14800 [Thiospirochaeta perfilievii]|uniref:DUF3592 domain-containing protein n=1 Tax=Thiospirochaeta perfilievii TaxID=252967 RepID=A0A5C1QET3_9SPIO|nr:hypothetical protein [Thiospirochaeta perfilievii]QEN05907.1 hypothetical protein EW093_14800 [Thiospirochaeta perfilievii]
MTESAPGGSIFLTISFLLIVIGFVYLKIRKTSPRLVKIIPILAFISIFGSIFNKYNTSKDYRYLRDILINKKHSVVEGRVENFKEMDDFNPESFSVDGVDFFYRDDRSNSAFNNIAANGGPIKEGLEVRIFYYENRIIGLWIKE